NQRNVTPHDLAKAPRDLRQRADRLVRLFAAQMAEDDLFPAAVATELQRFLHGAQSDVFLPHLWPRLAIDVATNQHRRARRNIAERIEPWNRLQIVRQAQILVRVESLENAAELQYA